MVFVYVIKSAINGNLYVGIAKNISNRLKEHKNGKSRYTKGLRPWQLVYFEEHPDWSAAREREKYFKSGSGKEKLKLMLSS